MFKRGDLVVVVGGWYSITVPGSVGVVTSVYDTDCRVDFIHYGGPRWDGPQHIFTINNDVLKLFDPDTQPDHLVAAVVRSKVRAAL